MTVTDIQYVSHYSLRGKIEIFILSLQLVSEIVRIKFC